MLVISGGMIKSGKLFWQSRTSRAFGVKVIGIVNKMRIILCFMVLWGEEIIEQLCRGKIFSD
jgi:hypothetical protein